MSMSKVGLIEEAIKLNLGKLSKDGALMVDTGRCTGRSANSRYIVSRPEQAESVNWGKTNKPLDLTFATRYFQKLEDKINSGKTYKMKGFVGCFPVEVTSTSPWHVAFAHNMFRTAPVQDLLKSIQDVRTIQIFHDPYGKVSDLGLEFSDETLIALDLTDLRVGITGTAYAGEIKKSAFSVCNFLMPDYGIFPMHSSANCLGDGTQSSVLFGLSGTGKTTLSADPKRALIGDDEIIWTETGISNLEGGCYAKLIKLSPEAEPEIFKAANRFGSILENVVYSEEKRSVDFDDDSKTENTRGSYDITALTNVFDQSSEADQPNTIIFLTADAFGALPAVAKLDFWQAQYHFMSGYTAKVAGTEIGVKEPTAAFSACFGAPFMPRHPSVYANLLAEKAKKSNATVWLLNTGWVGGYEKGQRFPIHVSRTLLEAIQNGSINSQLMVKHPVFGFEVPTSCPGVERKWLEIPTGSAVQQLAKKFQDNFAQFIGAVAPEVATAGGPLANAESSAGKTSSSPTASL